MPKPFRVYSTVPLPPNAEIVQHQGWPHVRVRINGRLTLCRVTANGKGYLRPSRCWYFNLRDEKGIVRRYRGFTDLRATEQLAADMVRKVALKQAGLIDPAEEHLQRPLSEHLADFAAYLRGKGDTEGHCQETVRLCQAVFQGCGFVRLADLDAVKVTAWLNERRQGQGAAIALPEGVQEFRPAEVAKLLGVSLQALRDMVARHQLPAYGQGKARRLPRRSVETLLELRSRGRAPETVNHYIRALRSFCRWLVRSQRLAANPLETLTLLPTAVDVRRRRRELTVEELRRLLETVRNSGRIFAGLSGWDRYVLYLTAVTTGLRVRALSHLTPADFDLDSFLPSVTVPGRYSKNRRTHTVPLPADTAAELRTYLSGRQPFLPIWPGTWAQGKRAAEMLRGDLQAAGIPYVTEGPEGPEYADFHALRHTYLTLLGRSGVDLRTLQELAGHSTPQLTARYSHRRLRDLGLAVSRMPSLVPGSMEQQSTGTDGQKKEDI